jgi:hypothetical protein
MGDENQPRGSKSRTIVWAVTLMFCSFVGGVFVGQHPQLIPIPGWVPAAPSTPDATASEPHPHQLPLDATRPTTQPETQIP